MFRVKYSHLSEAYPKLGVWTADAPSVMLEVMDSAAQEVVAQLFEHYGAIAANIHVRIAELPLMDSIRDLRQVKTMDDLTIL